MGDEDTSRTVLPDFIEVKTVEEANDIDKTVYRLERFSETRNRYIFVKRTR